MPQLPVIYYVAGILGVSIMAMALIFLGMLLLAAYPSAKVLVGDFFRLFGVLGKWFRRKAVEAEVEGVVNSFARHLNSDVQADILPDCRVQWVSRENHEAVLQPGCTLVRVSFTGLDRDLDTYNAACQYVRTSLLPDTKPFLRAATSGALDLLMVRILLTYGKRAALRVFNQRARDHDAATLDAYERLSESDRRGLFRHMLLSELSAYGDLVADHTPGPALEEETERFLSWFNDLVMREWRERITLHFRSEHFNVGIILVADGEVYGKHGIRPYVSRAHQYATSGCSSLYLLARGGRKSHVADEVVRDLCRNAGFSVSRRSSAVVTGTRDDEVVVTCIAIRADATAVQLDAWCHLAQDHARGQRAQALVEAVWRDGACVDVYGLKTEIPIDQLSGVALHDAARFIERDSTLLVDVLECDPANGVLRLSNAGTETDPKQLIDKLHGYAQEEQLAVVLRYTGYGAYESGLVVSLVLEERPIEGFVPRSGATYSRFAPLSTKYPVGTSIHVVLERYDPERGTYRCRVAGLSDPWEGVARYAEGQRVHAVAQEITEYRVVCELVEGLEGVIHVDELSWDGREHNDARIREVSVGDTIEAVVVNHDHSRRQIQLSVKRLATSPVEAYCARSAGTRVLGEVTAVLGRRAEVALLPDRVRGVLPIGEVSWHYCSGVDRLLEAGRQIQVLVREYDGDHDCAVVSMKRLADNAFEEFLRQHEAGSQVVATVVGHWEDRVLAEVRFGDRVVQSYIHRSEVSSVVWVDAETIGAVLPVGSAWHCVVKPPDRRAGVVELSRRRYLDISVDRAEYGAVHLVRAHRGRQGNWCGYSDTIEGVLVETGRKGVLAGSEYEVVVARRGGSGGRPELAIA